MKKVEIENVAAGKTEVFTQFSVVACGVIVELGMSTERFFPWHRVRSITSDNRGALEALFSNG